MFGDFQPSWIVLFCIPSQCPLPIISAAADDTLKGQGFQGVELGTNPMIFAVET